MGTEELGWNKGMGPFWLIIKHKLDWTANQSFLIHQSSKYILIVLLSAFSVYNKILMSFSFKKKKERKKKDAQMVR